MLGEGRLASVAVSEFVSVYVLYMCVCACASDKEKVHANESKNLAHASFYCSTLMHPHHMRADVRNSGLVGGDCVQDDSPECWVLLAGQLYYMNRVIFSNCLIFSRLSHHVFHLNAI